MITSLPLAVYVETNTTKNGEQLQRYTRIPYSDTAELKNNMRKYVIVVTKLNLKVKI